MRGTDQKLPRGIKLNGEKLLLDFSHCGARYRVTSLFSYTKANIIKAVQLRTQILTDLERNQFHIVNYKNKLSNIKILEHLDSEYHLKQQNAMIGELLYEQLDRYEKMYNHGNRSISTLVNYRSVMNCHLMPFFEYISLSNVNHAMIEEFIQGLKLSKKRINIVLTPLKQILRRAKKQQIIKNNPFDEFENHELTEFSINSDYEIMPFNDTEKMLIIKTADGQVKNFIQFAFWTGMRIGEIFALTWQDIDFINEIIHVNKSQTLGGVIRSTKTKAGIREVELTPLAITALIAQKTFTLDNNTSSRIFNNPFTKKPWSKPDAFRRYWVKILAEAGVQYRNPHQMRHTFISYMLSLGNKPEVLYRIVGHVNTEMIYRVYGKFINQGDNRKTLILDKEL